MNKLKRLKETYRNAKGNVEMNYLLNDSQRTLGQAIFQAERMGEKEGDELFDTLTLLDEYLDLAIEKIDCGMNPSEDLGDE